MAIDTEVKRKSVAGAGNRFWRAGVVVPNSTIDNPDRQAIGRSYSGIAAAAPGGVTFPIMSGEGIHSLIFESRVIR